MIQFENDLATIRWSSNDIGLSTYDTFLKVKMLPRYRIDRQDDQWIVQFPAEYASKLGDDTYQVERIEMPLPLPDFLFDRQECIIRVAWIKKRYCVFMDAGLGKTLIFLELARQLDALGKKCLIISPLNVVSQTLEQAMEFYGSDYPQIVNLHSRADNKYAWPTSVEGFVQDRKYNIAIINHAYFRQERDLSGIDCVMLDESSCLRNSLGKIRTNIINASKGTKRKYNFSATPAPNDRMEYAEQAVDLEMARSTDEFRSKFFVAKDQGYVMRKHAAKDFYNFLSGWSIFIRHPETYGFEPVHLPPYQEIKKLIPMTSEQIDLINRELTHDQQAIPGMPKKPKTWTERQLYNQISKGFVYVKDGKKKRSVFVPSLKPAAIREFVESYPGEKCLIWTVYDEEGEILFDELSKNGHKVSLLTGKTPLKKRAGLIADFRHGKTDILISKPRLLGLGLNLHVATLMVFSGSNDSWEQHYQALKRAWRFPQDKTVKVFLPYTQFESEILNNVLRKREQMELDFEQQESLYADSLYDEIQEYLETDFIPIRKETKMTYEPVITPDFEMYHVDSIKASLEGLKRESIDLIVTSIPFRNDLFAYTDNAGDMGNSGGVGEAGKHEFNLHLAYCLKGMYNTLKAGRLCCIEIGQSPLRKGVDGVIGMSDFRGDVIRGAIEAGFYQVGEWPVLGNPQAEAIVKHISTLNMNFVHEDRSRLAPMLNDYILIFRKPGESKTPIVNELVYYHEDKIIDTTRYSDLDPDWENQINILERKWQAYLDEPAKNEWALLEIDGELVIRDHSVIEMLSNLWQYGSVPAFVKREGHDWFIPVVRAFVTNENWIEYADGIAQTHEFNRAASQSNATSQRARYDTSWAKHKRTFAALKTGIAELDRQIQYGELTEHEVIMSFMGILYDINQGETLNTPYTRGRTKDMENADKHVCPFSIPLVNRLIRMYSNPGDVVLDPFAGVGTVPMVALELNRKAIGMELKPEYFLQAIEVCEQVIRQPEQIALF